MSRDIAIIGAAGYHGIGIDIPEAPPLCPEPLLPIGEEHGGTIVARLATQLRGVGFKPYIVVGKPGCMFPWHSRVYSEVYGFERDPAIDATSPWTQERVDYVAQFGEVILAPNPDGKAFTDSACLALEKIGYDWDRLIMSCGDHIYATGFLEDVVERVEWPCQLRPSPGGRAFQLFLFTPEVAKEYHRLARPFRRAGYGGWKGNAKSPHGSTRQGHRLAEIAPVRYVVDVLPDHDEYDFYDDIDSVGYYEAAVRWLNRGERSLRRVVEDGGFEIPDFDRCIKTANEPTLYLVREDDMTGLSISNWEVFMAIGEPPIVEVSPKEMQRYEILESI